MTADPEVVPWPAPARLSSSRRPTSPCTAPTCCTPAAMEPARRAGVVVRVRSIADPDGAGTTIADGAEPEPLALAHRRRVALLRRPCERGGAGPALAALEAACPGWVEPLLRGASGTEAFLLLSDPEPEEVPPLEPGAAALERGLASLALVGPPGALDSLVAEALESSAAARASPCATFRRACSTAASSSSRTASSTLPWSSCTAR